MNELLQIEKLTTLEVMKKYYIPDVNTTEVVGNK